MLMFMAACVCCILLLYSPTFMIWDTNILCKNSENFYFYAKYFSQNKIISIAKIFAGNSKTIHFVATLYCTLRPQYIPPVSLFI